MTLKFGLISGRYEAAEREVDGFAAEMLKQFRESRYAKDKVCLKDAFTGEKVHAQPEESEESDESEE
jgi:hypothetical protein